jgi:hypothetical protein
MSDCKSFANGNGNSHANGNVLPAWLRLNREFREVYEARYCFWTVQA